MPTSQESNRARPVRRRWLRRLAILVGVLVAYRMLIWLALRSVDEDELRSRVKEWAESRLYTDVSILSVDVNLNVLGRVGVNLHDVEVAPPHSVIFDRGLFFADPIGISCPVWGFLGVGVEPEVDVKYGELRLEWNEGGQCNLAGLGEPVGEPLPPVRFPFGPVHARRINVRVRKSQVKVRHPPKQMDLKADVAGALTIRPAARTISGSLKMDPILGELRNGKRIPAGATADVKHLLCRFSADDPRWELRECRATLRKVPSPLLQIVLPALAGTGPGLRVSGDLALEQRRFAFQGSVDGAEVLPLGWKGGMAVDAVCCPPPAASAREGGARADARLADARLVLRHNETEVARYAAFRDEAGEWSRLEGRCALLDLGALPPWYVGVPSWLAHYASGFETVRIQAATVGFVGLPRLVRSPALTGSLEARVRRCSDPGEAQESEPSWEVEVAITDMALPAQGAGAVIRALAELPAAAGRVEALRRKSLGLEPPPAEKESVALETLELSSLTVSCRVFADGTVDFVVRGEGPRLGRLGGGGKLAPDKAGCLTGQASLCLRGVAENLLASAPVSQEVLAAFQAQAASDEGLRLDIVVESKGGQIGPRYVEDVFRRWTQRHARKEKAEGQDKEPEAGKGNAGDGKGTKEAL